jgi:hypothetical protein
MNIHFYCLGEEKVAKAQSASARKIAKRKPLWENPELSRTAATPLRRIAAAEEIGPVVAFRATPPESNQIP